MEAVIVLMMIQGALGAADTLYYHEWRFRLVGHADETRVELQLHALRDFIYAIIFATLPWFAWSGTLAWVLMALLGAEIIITLTDFVVERRTRRSQGGLATGEFVTHVVMAIIYGAFLATLMPHLWAWTDGPTGWVRHDPVSSTVGVTCGVMALGVALSGFRDLGASFGWSGFAWPWAVSED